MVRYFFIPLSTHVNPIREAKRLFVCKITDCIPQCPPIAFRRCRLRKRKLNMKILPKAHEQNSLPILRHPIICCIHKLKSDIIAIASVTKCLDEIRKGCAISFKEHASDILHDKELRLFLINHPDIVPKQLPSFVIKPSHRASNTPRLARRSPYHAFAIGDLRRVNLSYRPCIKLRMLVIITICFPNILIELIRPNNMIACLFETQIQTATTRKERNNIGF